MATFTDKFFEDKAAGSLWDVAVSIKRGNPLPLDKDAVVHGLDELNAVASGAVSYPGQIIAVVIDAVMDGETVVSPERIDLYYLDHNKTPQPIGAADGKSLAFNSDNKLEIKGFKQADSLTLPQKQADGSIKWVAISEIVKGDGNTVTTLDEAANETALTVTLVGDTEAKKEYTVGLNVSAEANNQLSKKADGLYVAKFDDSALTEEINKKANSADVYTKTKADELLGAKANAADVYTKTEADGLLGNKANSADVYTKTETEQKITAAITAENLGQYAKATDVENALKDKADKSTTYTKTEVDNIKTNLESLIADQIHFNTKIVSGTSEMTDPGTLYLVKDDTAEGTDVYAEYVLVDGVATRIGDTTTDLSDYYQKSEVYTKEETDNQISSAVSEFGTNVTAPLDIAIQKLNGDVNTEGSVKKQIKDAIDASEQTAANTYLSQTDAANTYLTQTNAANTYLTKTDFATFEETYAGDLEEINGAIDDKADADAVYTKGEADNLLANKADKATTLAGYGIGDAYTKTQTDEAIAAKIKEMTGGESAADVLGLLNDYKKANDREVYGEEFVTEHTVEGVYTPDYTEDSRLDTAEADIDAIEKAIENINKKDGEQDLAISDRVTTADFNAYKEEAEGNFVDTKELAETVAGINKSIEDVDKKADDINADLTAHKEAYDAKVANFEQRIAANYNAINGEEGLVARMADAEERLGGIDESLENMSDANVIRDQKIGTLETLATVIDPAQPGNVLDKVALNTEKLAGIESGAQVNVIEEITFNGTKVTIEGKTAKIVDDYAYELPVATDSALGGVKSSPRTVNEETGVVTTDANSVNVAADGKMTVNSLDVDRLIQTGVLVLYGGSATDNL